MNLDNRAIARVTVVGMLFLKDNRFSMSKEEIISAFEAWVADPEFKADRAKLDELLEPFKKLRQESRDAQLKSYTEGGGTENDFQYSKDASDTRFDELMTIYKDKRKEQEKQRQQQEAHNLSEKKLLVEQLGGLIQDEENIGKAYQRFNAIKQKWNELGPVPNDKRRDLQADYSRLIEQFYYNINIYRELQQHDLKKNQDLKLEIIEKIKLLEKEDSINQLDFLIHKYLDEWDELGPTFKEEWEKIRDEFKLHVGKVFDRIREHRKGIKDEHETNHQKKLELVAKVEAIAANDINDVKLAQGFTRDVIQIQKEWKKLGYAGRGKNDTVWKTFRAACDAYFAKRDKFLSDNSDKFKEAKEQKRALIERAKEIYQGDDAKAIADELKNMQRKWKQIGKLFPQEEYKLFKEFRKYCDAFFNRKKELDEGRRKSESANLQLKEELLMKFNAELKAGLKSKGEKAINAWNEEWNKVGNVAPKMRGKVEKSFSDLVGKAYESIGISKAELAEKQFENRMDQIASSGDAERSLIEERNRIGAQIREAQTGLAQEESKMDFFKHSGDDNPLKKELEGRISKANEKIDALRAKKKRIDLAIKELKQASSQEAVEETVSEESAGEESES